jgi:hypothetical protein
MVASLYMNTITPTPQEKQPLRLIGIGLGLATGIVVIAWLVINIVNAVPGSFASLASLAESVRTYQSNTATTTTTVMNALAVTSDSSVVQSGSSVRLDWTAASIPGSFVFSYQCTDGVAIDFTDNDGTRSLSCDTNYNVGNVNSATLAVDSTKSRYIDVPYTVGFITTDGTEPVATDTEVLTVVNDSIALVFADDTEAASSTPTTTENRPTTPLTPGTPTYTTEYTYAIPVSDPNGRTNLAVRFLDTGRIVNNRFVADTIDNDEPGAIQFEVKNIGTKTSSTWTYEVSLPEGGSYESTNQVALKPNERAVITVGFGESDVTSYTFTVEVDTTGDSAAANNRFSQTVRFTN